jgi:hypothetical protein
VKDDFAADKPAAASHGQEPLGLSFGDSDQQAKPHRSIIVSDSSYVIKPTDGVFPNRRSRMNSAKPPS